ncbi:MAG: phenylalanine--tRNA ligase subunit alpha [Desulfobacterales bacterium]|nr:phenylalanine--tRNA ligase subunit alpha [Desulfobacterales bacterium]
MSEYLQNIDKIKQDFSTDISSANDFDFLESISTKYLGKKGKITQLLKSLAILPSEERPVAGKQANSLKKEIADAIQDKRKNIEEVLESTEQGIDVSLSGRTLERGYLHPLTQVNRQICDIFVKLGFSIEEGPEVEMDYYNFEALNIPKNHPARDMQDTFYVSENIVLRTHTSPIQIRTMEKIAPPVRIIAPGKVYRCDSDVTHTPMFHQVEGLLVDKGITFGDLKGILTMFVHRMFDERTSLKFRPSFFPFTEPSAEVDILCVMCRGKGCKICSHTGWLEVLGAGMVHPKVFENVGYDPSVISGFAFGMGVERIAMLKYSIDDIRKFFENDFRFLRQF